MTPRVAAIPAETPLHPSFSRAMVASQPQAPKTGGFPTISEDRKVPMIPKHRSFSQLDTWIRCGKSYQLRRVIPGVVERPGYARAGGSAVHLATEVYDRWRYSQDGK